jgi:acid phosphatase
LATQGITLTNYLAITHPSQPNYIAAVGGSTHWVVWDLFSRISNTEKTIVDLLDSKGISWSEYEEDMPYSGFEGDYVNQVNGANDYVRKHKYVSRDLHQNGWLT